MSISMLGTLSCYMVISSFTPGPGNILAMNTTTRFGWKKGKRLILGICCGYFLVQMICTLALYSLNMVLSPVLSILKYIGVAYMVWLAIYIAVSHPETSHSNKAPSFSTGFLLHQHTADSLSDSIYREFVITYFSWSWSHCYRKCSFCYMGFVRYQTAIQL